MELINKIEILKNEIEALEYKASVPANDLESLYRLKLSAFELYTHLKPVNEINLVLKDVDSSIWVLNEGLQPYKGAEKFKGTNETYKRTTFDREKRRILKDIDRIIEKLTRI